MATSFRASRRGCASARVAACCAVLLFAQLGAAYYLPGTFPQAWAAGEQLSAEVNSLRSFETELPFDYYSLPFCKPVGGVRPSSSNVNIGTFLTGQRLENSPYNFTMMTNQEVMDACPEASFYGPLSNHEAENLKQRIREGYRVNLVLDNLPVTTYDLDRSPDSVRTGFELGFEDDQGNTYVNNHIMFKILVHPVTAQFLTARDNFYAAEVDVRRRQLLADAAANATGGVLAGDDEVYYTVVGFEALACSIRRNAGWLPAPVSCPESTSTGKVVPPQPVAEGEKIVYTYDVMWEQSEIKWVSRWDSYLRMPRGQVHWLSILNSLLVLLLLSGVVAIVMFRTIRRDLAKYEEYLVNDPEAEKLTAPHHADSDLSGWKVLKGDVFRAPVNPKLLSTVVGSGLQIFLSSSLTLILGALGFLSPAVRGAMLSTLLGMYMLLSMVAGFAAVYLHGVITRSHWAWRGVALRTTAAVPTVLALVFLFLNLIIKHTGSVGAIPFGALLTFVATWLLVCFPLGYLGGFLATRTPLIEFPTRLGAVPREIPHSPEHSSKLMAMFFGSGLLVFGNIFVELYFAMTSMWQGYFYYLLGFVLAVVFLTVLITIQIAIVTTYMQFVQEDYRWWWHSFHRGGAVALYIGLYAVGFLIWSLHNLIGATSIMVYLTYMGLLVAAIYVALGSVGFVFAFWFTHSIFATAKAD
mmetsp:Transcript_3544/g.8825  ORF Transcript_3544/g.8825 Transcript_3544/m.8825 type:complete len:694 (-) Transcript_3544:103-2184(-)